MGALKVFLDSNILFSLCWKEPEGSTLGLFLDLQRWGDIKILVSHLVIEEASSNLRTKRPEAMSRFERIVGELTVVPDAEVPLDIELPDMDRIILSTAVAGGAEFFVTGNSADFAKLYGTKVRGTRVVDVRTFLHRRR